MVNAPPGKVLVVGGGVFGVTAALELSHRGWHVTVLDPGPIPHESAASTDVSKVIRMDYGSDRFYHELGELSLEGWDRWNRDWSRPLYHEHGFLILAPGPMRPGGFEYESYEMLGARGYAPKRLEPQSASRQYPEWDLARYPDGYLNERAGWAESGAFRQSVASTPRSNWSTTATAESCRPCCGEWPRKSGSHSTTRRPRPIFPAPARNPVPGLYPVLAGSELRDP